MRFVKMILLMLAIMVSGCVYSQSKHDSTIFWTQDVQLRWSDFKGAVPDPAPKWDATSFVELKTKARWVHGVPDFEVYAVFQRYDSWTRNSTSSLLLKHEQLHFDIGELYVRKMRKELSALRSKREGTPKDYLQVFDRLAEECNEMDSLYDAETAHGVYQSQQEVWNKKIAKELFRLRKYADDGFE